MSVVHVRFPSLLPKTKDFASIKSLRKTNKEEGGNVPKYVM